MIRVAIRFDDPSATSNRALEEGVIDELARSGLRATFAVIPFREVASKTVALDRDRASHLLVAHREHRIEIALHGHSHKRTRAEGQPSEFQGVERHQQAELLDQAARHLRAMFGEDCISGFVPPWNTYDANTLAALENLGFAYLSASWWFPQAYRGAVSIIPRTCQLTDLHSAIGQARGYARFQPSIIAVMHHYDFAEPNGSASAFGLNRFANLLDWLAKQPDIEVLTLCDLVRAATPQRLCAALAFQHTRQRLHWRLQRRLPDKCLVETPLWRALLA